MIIRIICVDPEDANNLIVYQVPENGRAYQLLCQLMSDAGLEYTTLTSNRKIKVEKPDTLVPAVEPKQEPVTLYPMDGYHGERTPT